MENSDNTLIDVSNSELETHQKILNAILTQFKETGYEPAVDDYHSGPNNSCACAVGCFFKPEEIGKNSITPETVLAAKFKVGKEFIFGIESGFDGDTVEEDETIMIDRPKEFWDGYEVGVLAWKQAKEYWNNK